MLYDRVVDTAAYLILWQIGMAGDRAAKQFTTDNACRTLLKEQLFEHYPQDHQVAIYEARALPTDEVRIEWIPLNQLDKVLVHQYSTLLIPPAKPMEIHPEREAAIKALNRSLAN